MKKKIKELEDLQARLETFIALNLRTLRRDNLSEWEKTNLEGQTSGFATTIALVKQIKKRGNIWKGGYLDNIGVTYSDQVQEIVDQMTAEDRLEQLDAALAIKINQED